MTSIFEEDSLNEFLAHLNKKTQDYVGELSHYYESIIASMPHNVYWLDRNCVLLGGNDNLARMFGLSSREELAGLTYAEMTQLAQWTEGQGETFRKAEEEVMATGQARFNVEEPPIFVNGKVRYYMSTKVPLCNKKGLVVGVLGISIDITDRKQAEEAERAALVRVNEEQERRSVAEMELRQAVTVLAVRVSSDLYEPLGVIKMSLHKLKSILSADADQEVNESIENLSLSVHQIYQIINKTLQPLTQAVQDDVIKNYWTTCSIKHCLRSTLDSYPFVHNQRSLIVWDHGDFTFLGNEVRMVRVLCNLIEHSLERIKKKNRGQIFITTGDEERSHILRFKETAGGLSRKIIDQFFDEDQIYTETPIGLAFCKFAMKSFGGDIVFRPIRANYIEFILSFPHLP